MSSWFNNIASQITEALPSVPDTLIPVTQNEIIDALTFQTPEMAAERKRIDLEERRKEAVKNALSSILPWETNNEEHEILVEECREAILALSSRAGANKDEKEESSKEKIDETPDKETTETMSIFQQPFGCGDLEGELRAMEALEDYPRLLRVFDLDAHVGLIQRLFEVDRNLVEMHSQLSGAGEVEYNFWKNYFYHCAVIRQKIGLSNSEIWDQAVTPKVASATSNKTSPDQPDGDNDKDGNDDVIAGDEGSITFESAPDSSSSANEADNGAAQITPVSAAKSAAVVASTTSSSSSSITRERSPEKDYEIVSPIVPSSKVDDSDEGDLDDLEAEIARELAG